MGAALTHLWGCSPVDLISDPGTSSDVQDAAASSASEPTKGTEPAADTSVRLPTVTPPAPTSSGPEHDAGTSATSEPESESVVSSERTTWAVSTDTEVPVVSSTEVTSTSEEPDPPIDPACLATSVDPMPPGLAGFAKVDGYDVAQTVGGLGSEVVYVGSERALRRELQSEEPRVVIVCGEIVLNSRLAITSNKTLIGLGPTSILRGGIDIRGVDGSYVSNVIVANLTLDPSTVTYGDGPGSLTGVWLEFAHHVWLDHLEIFDAPQGLVDIVSGSDFVTLSWNKFYFTEPALSNERRFGIRVGDVNDASVLERDGGKLRVTLHHNWFGDRIRQRIPRVAYGQAHIVNNYYSVTGNDTTIWGLSEHAQVLVEGNYFERTHRPHDIPPNSEVTNDELAQVAASGNVYYGTTGARKTQGAAFVPPYDLTRDSVVWLPSLIPWGAGPHSSFDPKPPWSDAGVVAPDAGSDAGWSSSDSVTESTPSVFDASEPGYTSTPDASVGSEATTGG